MTPDYRAMCAELLQELCCFYKPWDLKEERYSDAMKRARALLAQPVAEGPMDEELEEEFGAALLKLSGDSMNATAVAFARAVLARWGSPAAAPVPEPGEVPRIGHILRLAEIIREVDGKHDKGAAALAEAILSHPGIRSAGLTAALAKPGEVTELVAWLKENAEDEREMFNLDTLASLNLDRAAALLEGVTSQ